MPHPKVKTSHNSARHIQNHLFGRRKKHPDNTLIYSNTHTPIKSVRKLHIPQDPTTSYIEQTLVPNFLSTAYAAPSAIILLSLSALFGYLDAQHYLYPTVKLLVLSMHVTLTLHFIVYMLKGKSSFKETMKHQLMAIAHTLRENDYSAKDTKALLKMYMLSCESIVSTQESKDHLKYIGYINIMTHLMTLKRSVDLLYAWINQQEHNDILKLTTSSYSITAIIIIANFLSSARQAQKTQRQICTFLSESHRALITEKPNTIIKPFKVFEKERAAHSTAISLYAARETLTGLVLSVLILIPDNTFRGVVKSSVVFGLYVYNHWRDTNTRSHAEEETLSPHYVRVANRR